MSSLVSDAEIARAEAQVTAAYVTPIAGDAQVVPVELLEKVVGNLAFLFLLQSSVFLTRAGAKVKSGYNSQEAETWEILQQEASSCHLVLEELRAESENKDAEVTDICKIYFKTNFLYL